MIKGLRPRWIAVTLACLACAGDTPGPTGPVDPVPGTLELVFGTSFSDDGAAYVRLAGPEISNVTSGTPGLVLFTDERSGSVDIFVAGNLTDGAVMVRFRVPDVANLGQYTGLVQEVAAKGTYAQRDRNSYSVSIRVPD